MNRRMFCLMLCLFLLSGVKAQAADKVKNFVNNWDFEDRIVNPWRIIFKPNAGGDGILHIDDKESFTGKASLKVEIKNGGNHERGVHVIQQPLMEAIKKEREYTYCAWIKAEQERTLFMRLMKSGGGDITEPVRQQFTVDKEWREYWFTAKAKSDANLRVEFEVGLSDDDIWIDHIRFYEGEYVDEGLGKSKAVMKGDSMLSTCWSRIKAGW